MTGSATKPLKKHIATGHSPLAAAKGLCYWLTLLLLLAPSLANAQIIKDDELPQNQGVGVVDKRGSLINPDLTFTDSHGDDFAIGAHFDGKLPVILLLAYYDCPLLCDLMMEHLKVALSNTDLRPGEDYRLLVISFDHTNTTEQAQAKRQRLLRGFDPPLTNGEAAAVVFATSTPAQVRALANQIGYYYRYLPESGEFSHPPAVMFIKPDGTLHTTLQGINMDPRQIEIALNEASEGRTASFFEQMAFTCFAYNPETGQYTMAVMNLMRLVAGSVAAALLLIIAGLSLTSYLAGRKRCRHLHTYSTGNPPV